MTVRCRLALLFVLTLAGFASLFAVEEAGRRIVDRAAGLAALAADAGVELLHMRRHEKNFLLRRDRQYIEVVGQHLAAARELLGRIAAGDESSSGQCARASGFLDAYWADFRELASAYIILGLTDQSGRLQAFVEQHLSLVEAVRRLGGKDQDVAVLDLEAKENSYLLQVEQEVAAAVLDALPALKGHSKHTLVRGQGDTAQGVAAALARLEQSVLQHPDRSGARELALALIAEASRSFAGIVGEFGRRKDLEVRLVGTVRDLEAVVAEIRDQHRFRAERITARVRALQLALQVGTVLAVALMALGIARSITRPLKSLQRYSGQVAAGDLDARAEGRFRGEFALLHQDITRMVETLRSMIQDLRAKEEEAHGEALRASAAMRQAEAASRMKSSFLSLVSHELRTPLTSVLGFLKMARKRLLRKILPAQDPSGIQEELGKLQGDLGISIAAAEDLVGMVEQVIDLTEMESGAVELDMGPVSLAEAAEAVGPALAQRAREKGLDYVQDIPADLPRVRGSREWLGRALEALLCNAVKFTGQGRVEFRAENRGGEVVASVADTGPGIPPEMQAELFQPFRQRVDNLTDKPKGLGLGLAICKYVVDVHGGRVWVESEPGRGSAFFIALPALPG
ncbi:MAG: HAMP domain-containing sensor histidine kinase [Thermodesulfobacteriota bacterium]